MQEPWLNGATIYYQLVEIKSGLLYIIQCKLIIKASYICGLACLVLGGIRTFNKKVQFVASIARVNCNWVSDAVSQWLEDSNSQ